MPTIHLYSIIFQLIGEIFALIIISSILIFLLDFIFLYIGVSIARIRIYCIIDVYQARKNILDKIYTAIKVMFSVKENIDIMSAISISNLKYKILINGRYFPKVIIYENFNNAAD